MGQRNCLEQHARAAESALDAGTFLGRAFAPAHEHPARQQHRPGTALYRQQWGSELLTHPLSAEGRMVSATQPIFEWNAITMHFFHTTFNCKSESVDEKYVCQTRWTLICIIFLVETWPKSVKPKPQWGLLVFWAWLWYYTKVNFSVLSHFHIANNTTFDSAEDLRNRTSCFGNGKKKFCMPNFEQKIGIFTN